MTAGRTGERLTPSAQAPGHEGVGPKGNRVIVTVGGESFIGYSFTEEQHTGTTINLREQLQIPGNRIFIQEGPTYGMYDTVEHVKVGGSRGSSYATFERHYTITDLYEIALQGDNAMATYRGVANVKKLLAPNDDLRAASGRGRQSQIQGDILTVGGSRGRGINNPRVVVILTSQSATEQEVLELAVSNVANRAVADYSQTAEDYFKGLRVRLGFTKDQASLERNGYRKPGFGGD